MLFEMTSFQMTFHPAAGQSAFGRIMLSFEMTSFKVAYHLANDVMLSFEVASFKVADHPAIDRAMFSFEVSYCLVADRYPTINSHLYVFFEVTVLKNKLKKTVVGHPPATDRPLCVII